LQPKSAVKRRVISTGCVWC